MGPVGESVTEVKENLAEVRDRMAAACIRSGRDPAHVKLVGVTKTVPIERIIQGIEAGIEIIGENYVQEAQKKKDALAGYPVCRHLIGHLQTNKAKAALECCDWIETVDREGLAIELNNRAKNADRRVQVLVQVNIGGEQTKSGLPPGELLPFFELLLHLDWLEARGLMALPPFFDQPERARPYFRQMRSLLDRLRENSPRPEILTELSMGMSGDFEVAIEEGATLVRIGTAIFGKRGENKSN